MTTLFDLNILEGATIVLAMVLLFVLFYGLLVKTKPLGEGKDGIYALISIAVTILALTTETIREMIFFMAPWFAIILFVGFFVIFILMALGAKEDVLAGNQLKGIIIGISVVLVLFAFFGNIAEPSEERTNTTMPNFLVEAGETLVHPQVLGFITMMLVAAVTIILLTKKA